MGNRPRPQGGWGVTFGIRADPCDNTGVCGSGVRTCDPSWHMGRHLTHGRVQ
jgi:hypothetical protein